MPIVYTPVLKGKEGEYGALEELSTRLQDAILPLIEVPNVPFDYVNERPARSLDDHVAGIADRLARCWRDRALYLDLPWFGQEERLQDGRVAVGAVLRACTTANVRAIPIVRTSSSAGYLQAVRDHLPTAGGAFCVRLVAADFDEEGDVNPGEAVDELLRRLNAHDVTNGDLVIDLGDVGSDVGRATLIARSVLGQVPRHPEWRRMILAAASFPENLSDISAAATSRLPRVEWLLRERLRRRGGLPRNDLIFGDYAIAHPLPAELDPRTMRMSASIRYTTREDWLILKGRNVRQFGFDQYYDLARELVSLPDYSGEDFSWGDGFIARCARRETGPGNATTWRKVGTNHHMALVVQQLTANPHDS